LAADSDSPTVLGESTAFTATITAGSNVTFTWDFGDGNQGSGPITSHTYPAAGTYTATVTATNGLGSESAQTLVTVTNGVGGETATDLFLPLLMVAEPPVYPDLIVESIQTGEGGLAVIIRNVGDAPVTSAFWVDLYVDPNPAPNQVNQIWGDLAEQGGVWGVTAQALPLAPGQSLTLQVGDGFYDRSRSRLPDQLPAGSALYAQVDSYNLESGFGAVLERHEAEGGSYNNILGPVTLAAGVALPPAGERGGADSVGWTDLPWRALLHGDAPDLSTAQGE
jgi:PKD repeat protein